MTITITVQNNKAMQKQYEDLRNQNNATINSTTGSGNNSTGVNADDLEEFRNIFKDDED